MPDPIPDLIAKAEAVARLWDIYLFTHGQPEARQKRADVMQEAVGNLLAAVDKAKGAAHG